jgi:RNA polymerase sigma-70 factor (ECF subfamily)
VTSPVLEHPLAADAALRQRLIGLARHWLGDASAAEDLLHDTYLRTADVALPDSISGREAWLVTVLHNLCVDQLRRQGRYQAILGQLAKPWSDAFERDQPEHLAARAQRVDEALLNLLHNLRADEVATVLLYEVFDFSHAELAALSSGTEVASRQRLRRMMERLNGSAPAAVPEDDDLAALLALCRQALARCETAALVTLVRTGAPQAIAAAAQPLQSSPTQDSTAPKTQLVHVGNRLALLIETGNGPATLIPMGEVMFEAA